MKKLCLLIAILIISFTFIACDEEDTNNSNNSGKLIDVTTDQGISLKLPSNMPFQTVDGNQLYVNSETGDSAVIKIVENMDSSFLEWTKEDALATYQTSYPDAVIQSFENNIKINGNDALVAKIDLTTPAGSPITLVLVFVSDGSSNYILNFTYGRDKLESILAQNIQKCIESITT